MPLLVPILLFAVFPTSQKMMFIRRREYAATASATASRAATTSAPHPIDLRNTAQVRRVRSRVQYKVRCGPFQRCAGLPGGPPEYCGPYEAYLDREITLNPRLPSNEALLHPR